MNIKEAQDQRNSGDFYQIFKEELTLTIPWNKKGKNTFRIILWACITRYQNQGEYRNKRKVEPTSLVNIDATVLSKALIASHEIHHARAATYANWITALCRNRRATVPRSAGKSETHFSGEKCIELEIIMLCIQASHTKTFASKLESQAGEGTW